jgi:hypothetical protein
MNVLYYLSKTDYSIVTKCNSRTRMHQRSLGMFVLITALFAFLSSYYALTTIFGDWDEISQSYILAIKDKVLVGGCSLLYALMIGMIDREIVASKDKRAALLRIPLAIIIGIIVSVPIKIKVLERRINQKIKDEQIAGMLPFKKEQDKFIAITDSTISNLELQINYYTKLKIDEQKRMEGEDLGYHGAGLSGIIGQGQHFSYAKTNAENYGRVIDDLNEKIREKQEYRTERLGQMQKDFNIYKPNSTYDLWSKYESLHKLVKEDKTNQARMMVMGLTLLFILLELIPSLIKLLSQESEYEMVNDFVDDCARKKLEMSLADVDSNSDPDDYIIIPEIQVA